MAQHTEEGARGRAQKAPENNDLKERRAGWSEPGPVLYLGPSEGMQEMQTMRTSPRGVLEDDLM